MDCPSDIYKPIVKLIINEFCLADSSLWDTVGKNLMSYLRNFSEAVEEFAIECEVSDELERKFLKDAGFSVVTEWYSMRK